MVVLFYWVFEAGMPKQALMDELTAFQYNKAAIPDG